MGVCLPRLGWAHLFPKLVKGSGDQKLVAVYDLDGGQLFS